MGEAARKGRALESHGSKTALLRWAFAHRVGSYIKPYSSTLALSLCGVRRFIRAARHAPSPAR